MNEKSLEQVQKSAQDVYDKYKHLRPVIVDPKFDELRSQVLRDLFLAIEEIIK